MGGLSIWHWLLVAFVLVVAAVAKIFERPFWRLLLGTALAFVLALTITKYLLPGGAGSPIIILVLALSAIGSLVIVMLFVPKLKMETPSDEAGTSLNREDPVNTGSEVPAGVTPRPKQVIRMVPTDERAPEERRTGEMEASGTTVGGMVAQGTAASGRQVILAGI